MPFDFGGDMYFPILVNSLCHVAVYLHYFCTCLGLNPWWSPHLATLQVAQFAAIFLQSLLAFYEGPRCGSPDFSKILMMVYTGSMLVLFSDFFFKRYILRQPAYDMCGVMKNDPAEAGLSTLSYVGSVRLGPDGSAVVCLPRHFREGLSSPLYVYHLTPVGSPMPNLYVSREVLWGSGISDGEINCKRGDRTSSEGVVLMEQVVQRAGGSYSFVVRGGRPKGLVSWTVCCVVGDEAIRQH
ncbi:hypothetical protein NSK_007650 [Nannochloropsis salina CCMP1776]|jgi:hypothetical protein|uniref:Elongation of fatty acids protein n=1 Tax=Nannochloropsis salina CCMP1776 TaxID=1027361 RepID=A0A4D9CSJ6_9STRA|nr:hypothetical protein NSK_007650 [Nannochloropsis salina CCMP1776]|eukprot:TFJ81007.1 hypothetical protein NSK_007650 [Nannochloropsis salina CCMP1776]